MPKPITAEALELSREGVAKGELMPRRTNDDNYDLNRDLDEDFNFDLLADVRRRLELVEKRDANASEAARISAEARALHEGSDPDDVDPDPDVTRGEQILAKAQSALHHGVTKDGIMERAMRAFSYPHQIGLVSGYLAVGNAEAVAKALDMVAQAEGRVERVDADAAFNGVARQYGLDDESRDVRAELDDLRQQIATLTGRLVQLEARPTSAPQEVVAKAYERTSAPRATSRTTRRRCYSADKGSLTRQLPSACSRA